MSTIAQQAVGEHGLSQSHRAEAKRLATVAHEGMNGQFIPVATTIELARLHAELALLDSLDEIKAALAVLATASAR